MKDPRKEKIRALKTQIQTENDELEKAVQGSPIADPDLTEEQRKEKVKEFQDDMAKRRAGISSLKTELKLTRLNKYSSAFFEWLPTPPNRATMRMMRKFQRK